MTQPFYIRQVAYDSKSDTLWVRAWIEAAVAEARAAGATFFRASLDEASTRRRLALVEGWEVQPDDQGQPRFFVEEVAGADVAGGSA